ncbi:MAG: hypothetical protein IT426_05960 [Pirellulales bacterium]|nr:hypothetical protein [Pirellulales bacterium]
MNLRTRAEPRGRIALRSILSGVIVFQWLTIFLLFAGVPLRAAVVILVNRTEKPVKFAILREGGSPSALALAAGEQKVVPAEERIGIAFNADKTERRYRLPANTIQCFVPKDGSFDLNALELAVPPGEEGLPPPQPRIIARTPLKIPVKILADNAQPAVRKIWEKAFRERIAKAAKIFEEHCGAVFEVVAVEMWESDGTITDFDQSLREFEAKVAPAPAVLAIGFTSRYEKPDGQTHLGGTRGPLHPYLLVREWSQHVSKNERLEILAHELGHFLGAVHSGAADSLMRPKLGDRLSNLAAFRIGFDPLNTLAMNILADELRAGPYRGLHRLPLDARRQLLRIYCTLGKETPQDPAAPQYIALLNLPARKPQPTAIQKMSLAEATKTVVRAIAGAAEINNLAIRVYAGDDLTEFYVNRAAAAAAGLPPELARDAFLLGLGIGLNDADWVRRFPTFGTVCRQIETEDEFAARVKRLGRPTLRKRRDLASHFMLSAALTVHFGPAAAEKAGLLKELADAQGKSGFSFADLAADLSGIAFAEAVRAGKTSLERLSEAFSAAQYLPEIDGLQENISLKDFEKNYGSLDDERFQREFLKLKSRVKQLPGLQKASAESKW